MIGTTKDATTATTSCFGVLMGAFVRAVVRVFGVCVVRRGALVRFAHEILRMALPCSGPKPAKYKCPFTAAQPLTGCAERLFRTSTLECRLHTGDRGEVDIMRPSEGHVAGSIPAGRTRHFQRPTSGRVDGQGITGSMPAHALLASWASRWLMQAAAPA